MSPSTVSTILRHADLKPHRLRYWLRPPQTASERAEFERQVNAFVEFYHHPPTDGVSVSLDECTGIQALERVRLPLRVGEVERQEFQYIRHGTLDLFAALVVPTGRVFGKLYPRHTRWELVDFLKCLDHHLPEKDYGRLHLITDNLATRNTPEVKEWLREQRGRVVFHFLPTHASWLNQIELWFSILRRKCLRRLSSSGLSDLQQAVEAFIETYNRYYAHPFRWTWKGYPLRI
jgi:transposase